MDDYIRDLMRIVITYKMEHMVRVVPGNGRESGFLLGKLDKN